MDPKIIDQKQPRAVVEDAASKTFGDMAKVAVDIERSILVVGCAIHYQCRNVLIENGSHKDNIWGASVYPFAEQEKQIACISTSVNPREENLSVEIESPEIQKRVRAIIQNLLLS